MRFEIYFHILLKDFRRHGLTRDVRALFRLVLLIISSIARPLVMMTLPGSLLAGFVGGLTPSAQAAVRTWNGSGDGQHWSDPENWNAFRKPQPGDDLIFEQSGFTDLPDMVNDLPGVTVRSMLFQADTLFSADWVLNGNEVTITGSISLGSSSDETVHINCGLKLGGNVVFYSGDQYTDAELTLRLNGARIISCILMPTGRWRQVIFHGLLMYFEGKRVTLCWVRGFYHERPICRL